MGSAMNLILMMAISVDGIIAKDQDHFTEWTCSSDKRLFKQITQEAGVLIMGSRTYATIGKPLPGRLNVVYTHHPERFGPAENLILTQSRPGELLSELAARGYSKAILAGGAAINTLFACENLIDEMLITVSPRIFGQGLTLFTEALEMELNLLSTDQLDSDSLLLHYKVLRAGSDSHTTG
jgi:dihydrofolate reductase